MTDANEGKLQMQLAVLHQLCRGALSSVTHAGLKQLAGRFSGLDGVSFAGLGVCNVEIGVNAVGFVGRIGEGCLDGTDAGSDVAS